MTATDPTATDPTATAPQPAPLDPDAIETRAHYYDLLSHQIGNSHAPDLVKAGHACADDVPELVAEVRRLRAEREGFRRERAILHWAADRLNGVPATLTADTLLRRWADELVGVLAGPLSTVPPAGTEGDQ